MDIIRGNFLNNFWFGFDPYFLDGIEFMWRPSSSFMNIFSENLSIPIPHFNWFTDWNNPSLNSVFNFSNNNTNNYIPTFDSNNYFGLTNPIPVPQQITSNNMVTPVPTAATGINSKMVAKAKSYVGVVNCSQEGNRLFSPKGYKNTQWYKTHGRWGWCCDFAVHCAKDTLGSKYPKDMITSSPYGLMDAANKHGAYLKVPTSNKNNWLTNNIKPGDIIYMEGKGDSGKHIAIVESVGANGKINAISGNSGGGKVISTTFNINSSGIYVFISLNKLAA